MLWGDLHEQLYQLSQPPSYPQALLDHAQAHWPDYASEFRAVLAHMVACPDEYMDEQVSIHVYAGYLLAQFRDENCFDIAQGLLAMPEEQLENVLGLEFHDVIAPWVAAFCSHTTPHQQWLIDVAVGSYRHSMPSRHLALQALARCAVEGIVPRSQFIDTAMEFCRRLISEAALDTRVDDGNYAFGYDTYVSFAICDLLDVDLPATLLEEIQSWYAQGHVDTTTITFEEVTLALEQVQHKAAQNPALSPWPILGALGLPKDIHTELSNWAWFNNGGARQKGDMPDFLSHLNSAPATTAKTGRNDPCPCGSGKKFKKCCDA
jgi:Protein of unknown function (DUF1186)/SEC-C motif